MQPDHDRSRLVRVSAVLSCLAVAAAAIGVGAFMWLQPAAVGAELPLPPEDDGAGRPRPPGLYDAGFEPEPPGLRPFPIDAAVPPPGLDAGAPLPLPK